MKNPPAFAWRVSLGGLLRKSVIADYGGRFRISQASTNTIASEESSGCVGAKRRLGVPHHAKFVS